MIHRSGLSARSFLPMSAATSRTCSTFFLSSVSGMVKNWGAWGSMAPPITVDIIAASPWPGGFARKNISPAALQQGGLDASLTRHNRLHSRNGSKYGFAPDQVSFLPAITPDSDHDEETAQWLRCR